MRTRRLLPVSLLLVSLTAPAPLLANATAEQHTKVSLGGFLGRVANLFGGKAARDGVTTTSIVEGDRRALIAGDSAEIVDLSEEKIYNLDLRRKTYTVTTFDEMRKRFEEAQKEAERSASAEQPRPEQGGPEYVVDVDVRETGERQALHGWDTRQVIVTATVHEKGKKLEESGGFVLTGDLWLGPSVPALDELAAFELKYAQALWGGLVAGMDFQKLAMLKAMAPAFDDAMKSYQAKSASLKGTPIRTTLTFETVAAPAESSQHQEASASSGATLDPTAAAARALGGFVKKKREARQAESGPADPSRSTLFTSTNELLRADGSADASRLAIPADFKLRK